MPPLSWPKDLKKAYSYILDRLFDKIMIVPFLCGWRCISRNLLSLTSQRLGHCGQLPIQMTSSIAVCVDHCNTQVAEIHARVLPFFLT